MLQTVANQAKIKALFSNEYYPRMSEGPNDSPRNGLRDYARRRLRRHFVWRKPFLPRLHPDRHRLGEPLGIVTVSGFSRR